MKIGEAIKLAMKNKKITQTELAEMVGVKSQSVIAERLKMDNISINTVLDMLEAIGYDLIIQEKSDYDSSNSQFIISRQ